MRVSAPPVRRGRVPRRATPRPLPRTAFKSPIPLAGPPPPRRVLAARRSRSITVMIADDDALLRQTLAILLNQQEDIQVVGDAAEGAQAVSLAEGLQPDILLLDIRMPGLSGLQALPKIRAKSPRTKVLILSGLSGEESVAQALMYGASGYITKAGTPTELVRAIRAVHSEEIWADRRVVAQALEALRQRVNGGNGAAEPGESLTDREREVIRWAVQGMTNKEIANQLGISDKTVKTHLSNVFAKLKVGRRIQLHPFIANSVPE